MSRIPTHAFSYAFTHIPQFVRDDLGSLEREGVLYADHWIEELADFRHVRIQLTSQEAREYARRCWAFELWLRARSPRWAKNTPGIDADVASEADAYEGPGPNGEKIVPYHCFAAFMGHHLESIACGGVSERQTVLELQGKELVLLTLSRAVQALTPTIRSFNAREKCLQPWTISCEDDIRDLLYVMLKPAIYDLVKEEPTPSLAATHKYVDLSSRASRLFVEVKWVNKRRQWKSILGQMQVDIQCYHTHLSCETLVFVVVDAVRDIPDPRLLEQELTGQQSVKGRTLDIRVYIVEP